MEGSARRRRTHTDRVRARKAARDQVKHWRPRRDSNSRSRLRRAVLYPLSYGGGLFSVRWLVKGREAMYQRDWGLALWHSFAM